MTLHRLKSAGESPDNSPVDSELWSRLDFAQPPEVFCASWLRLQCAVLPACASAVVVLRDPETDKFSPSATFPQSAAIDKSLTAIAELALAEREGQIADAQADGSTLMAYPLLAADVLEGVVAMKLTGAINQEAVRNQVQWGTVWLRAYLGQRATRDTELTNERLMTVLDLIAVVLEQDSFDAASLALVTELAGQLDCDRVSLGFRGVRGHAEVVALSQSTTLVEKMNLIRAMAAAMDETLDQNEMVLWPPVPGAKTAESAHRELAELIPVGQIVTVPLYTAKHPCGALLVETSPGHSLDDIALEQIQSVALAVGPMLEAKRRMSQSLLRTVGQAGGEQLRRFLGPGYLGRKTAGLALTAIVAALTFIDIDYRITADSVLEGAVQRTLAASLDGYLVEANVRAGDLVREGQVLSVLDDRDLRLQYLQVETERVQLQQQMQQAAAGFERAKAQVIDAQIGQNEARLALLAEQISRTRIVAPFDGIVIQGDLSQSLGTAVARGEPLFVLAPLDAYRVVLKVDESDIRYLAVGQSGNLVLTSLPEVALPIEVTKVTPVATAEEGVNRFRVDAELLELREDLRPGMEGVGKVLVDRRAVGWVWGHRLFDWLRLQLWRWTP